MDTELDTFLSLAESNLKTGRVGRSDELETGLRKLLLENGARFIELLFNSEDLLVPGDERLCGEKRMGKPPRTVLTVFGPIRLLRNGYYNPKESSCRYPLDEALLLVEGFTPSAAKLAGRCAGDDSFAEAGENLKALAGIHIEPRRIQRLVQAVGPVLNEKLYRPGEAESLSVPRMYISADGTGIPLRKAELAGRKGKQPDGTAKTHEVKTGCIFTQHPFEDDEKPLRDLDSTTYVATTERTNAFGAKLLTEARRRNLGGAKETVFISDGAAWLRRIAKENFPGATRILDFYHASEHLHELAKLLWPGAEVPLQFARWKKQMREGKIRSIVAQAQALTTEANREQAEKQLNYFRNNFEAMRYDLFRSKGMFIGSGVIEAGCKSVVGKRCKQSGMFWSVSGAENILTLRIARQNGRYDSIWTDECLRKIRKAA
jgi:hypothetical protein